MIFEEMLDFCISTYRSLESVSQDIMKFLSRSLNDVLNMSSSLTFMNVSLFSVLVGGGLIAFLTYKLIAFIVDILP